MTKEKYLYSFINILLIVVIILTATFCSNSDNQNNSVEKANIKDGYKNLNITILLDLSDRISNKKNPDQYKKDIIFINNVLDAFKQFLGKKGVVHSEDKIKVIFYPSANYDLYQEIADSLNVDFSKYDFLERKKLYDKITTLYNKNLKKLYSLASNAKTYNGSDLFNYFKHRVSDDCILSDSNFVNMLIILTDGYIYEANSKYQDGNKFSYLIPEANHIKIFRKEYNWEEIFEKNNYGLIPLNNNLSSLCVLVGEINPPENSPKDFDILKKYWSNWLESQHVKKENYKIIKTDLNTLNRDIIHNFFNKIISL